MKAIQTEYNGYLFRSRLEARWAVFFDALGIEYLYEHEGFDLGEPLGWYLPDFWLPGIECWAEVKPKIFTEIEFDKCKKLGNCLLLDSGTPIGMRGYVYTDFPKELTYQNYLTDDLTGGGYKDYGKVMLEYSKRKGRPWLLLGETVFDYDHNDSIRATEAAKQARFGA